jgi:Transglutaminase-like superfamily
MKSPAPLRYFVASIDILTIASFFLLLLAAAWEHSTRTYLRGFSDAIVPASGAPIEKVETILAWMKNGPQRQTSTAPAQLSLRDPENTLNYRALLQVCGTATNAFVNLAISAGVPARRLLLLDEKNVTQHVTAEVLIDGAWILVDPAFRTILHDASDRTLTRQQMKDPVIFAQATASLANYDPSFSYQRTVHVHISRVPLIGLPLKKLLNRTWSGWSDSVFWTLLLERESFAALFLSALLFIFFLLARFVVRRFAAMRLGFEPYRIGDRLFHQRLLPRQQQPEDGVLTSTTGQA